MKFSIFVYSGIPGVGKTYLINKEAERLRKLGKKVYIWTERAYLFCLSMFYNKIPGSAFNIQSESWNGKQYIAENVMDILKNEPDSIHLIERGIHDCYKIFTSVLETETWPEKKFVSGKWVETGKMIPALNKAECKVLKKNYINCQKNSYIWSNCTYVFINTSIDKSLNRIMKRGRKSEINIEKEYLELLQKAGEEMKDWLSKNFKNIKITDIDNEKDDI